MAPKTSGFVNKKLAVIILLYFEIDAVRQVSAALKSAIDYVFNPTDVVDITPDSCFVALNTKYVEADQPAYFIINDLLPVLNTAYRLEENVVIGLVDFQTLIWPSGKDPGLRSTDAVVVFPKLPLDRSCLSTENLNLRTPILRKYEGSVAIGLVVQFINNHCHTYREPKGHLTIDGLHRQEILDSLFHVHDSSTNMLVLANNFLASRDAYCTKNTCNNSRKNADIMHNDYKDMQIPLRSNDFELQKCEVITVPNHKDFFHNFLKVSKPVIIKDAIKHWPAITKWTNEYFRGNYGDKQVHIKLTPSGEFEGVDFASQFENYKQFRIPDNVKRQLLFPDLVVVRPATANMNFSTFLDILEAVSNGSLTGYSAYLEYSSIADIVPDLEGDISEMAFFENILTLAHTNIWLSDGDTLGKLHFDPFDNFLCQISGRKQVILFEPHDNRKLYEAHIPEAMLEYDKGRQQFVKKALVDTTSMVMSPVDITKPDFERFPLFAETHPLNCTIDEGDVLFMPSFWWHEVQSYPNINQKRNLAVNFWYEPFLTKEFPCQHCKLDINPKYRHLLHTMN